MNNAMLVSAKRKNFLIRLVTGEVSLPITYWVFGYLVNILLWAILFFLEEYAEFLGNWEHIYAVCIGVYIFCIIYSVFVCIAIWNSAENYKGKELWAILAKVAVILGLLKTVLGISQAFFPSAEEQLKQFKAGVMSYNKELPTMVDDETELQSISFEGNNLVYNVKLTRVLDSEVDVYQFSSIMKPRLVVACCENRTLNNFFDLGGKVSYSYKDKRSNPIVEIAIRKSDCS